MSLALPRAAALARMVLQHLHSCSEMASRCLKILNRTFGGVADPEVDMINRSLHASIGKVEYYPDNFRFPSLL